MPVANMGEKSDILEENLCGAFASFARTGKPVLPNGPEWKPFTAENHEVMVFDSPCRQGERFDDELIEAYLKTVPTPVMQP